MQPQPPAGPPAFTPPTPSRHGVPPWLVVVLVLGAVVVLLGGVLGGVAIYRTLSGSGAEDGRDLAHPVGLHPVTSTHAKPCRSRDVPGTKTCYQLGTGMTLTEVEDLTVEEGSDGQSVVLISLRPDDAKQFAALTRRVAGAAPPGNQLAIVVGAKVVSAPQVTQQIGGGEVQIYGGYTSDEAHRLADQITG